MSDAALSAPPPPVDVAAGRAWVAAYVPFVHYVEGVHAAATGAEAEHGEGGGKREVAEGEGHHQP